MSRTKGLHIKNFQDFVRKRFGEEGFQKLLAQLDPADRVFLSQEAIIGTWIDAQLWWRLLFALDKILGRGDFKLLRECKANDARVSLGGIYKLFIRLTNPEVVINAFPILWPRYYDTGKVKVLKVENHHAEIRISDFPDFPLHHEEEIHGFCGEALMMAGAKNVIFTHTTCIAKGDPHCTFLVDWR